MHDWSKFSPTEFWESVKYFDGHKSPITVCKVDKGYSEALAGNAIDTSDQLYVSVCQMFATRYRM